MNLRNNPDGTCNCRPLGKGCFFTGFLGGPCNCACHKPNTPKTKWDEKWKDKWNNDDFISDFSVELDPEKIRDFIRQTLQEELSLLGEKTNNLPVYYRSKFSKDCSRNETAEERNTEMITLSDALTLLRQHKEELK